MLDYIRSSAQSFGVKLAFGVIILVFVFWGVGSFREGDMSKVVAQVNGESILESQFFRQYQLIENQLMNRGMSREQMRNEHLGRQVLQTMVAHTLVRQEADRLGLSITPVELRREIERNPIFHNDQGTIDKESYQRGLSAMRMSAGVFEDQMREEMTYDRMLEMMASAVWLDDNAARSRFDFLFEKRVLSSIFLDAKDFMNDITLTADEEKAYYDAHTARFTVPKKAAMTYIRLLPEKLVDPKTVTEEEARKWYTDNSKEFIKKEAVRVSHILVPLAPGADQAAKDAAHATIAGIQEALRRGESFASLANKHNAANAAGKDGELGWIERGMTVEPFENAAFSQEVGVVSDKPVETRFGLHLLLVQEKRAEETTPFAKVRDDVIKKVALEKGQEKIAEVGENLLEDNLLGKDLSVSAKQAGLAAEKTAPLSAAEIAEKLGFKADDVNIILSGTPVDTLLQAGDTVYVVRVDSIEPEKVQPFEEVEKDIALTLRREKAEARAVEKAKEMLPTLPKGELADAAKQTLHAETSGAIERMGDFPPFSTNPELLKAVFSADPGTWLSTPYVVRQKESSGALLVHIDSTLAASESDWDRIKNIFEGGLARETADQLRSVFLNELHRKAKGITVNTEKADMVDR